MEFRKEKARLNKYLVPIEVAEEDDRIYLRFAFNAPLSEALKGFQGRTWHGYDTPPRKMWSILNNERNRFRLRKLLNQPVFEQWDKPLEHFDLPREGIQLWEHQKEIYNHVLTRKRSVVAGDMGVGKSLIAILMMEYLVKVGFCDQEDCWFVGPTNAVNSFNRELVKWNSKLKPEIFTYDRLVSFLKTYTGEHPKVLICDEASKLKNWSTQRTKAVKHVTDFMQGAIDSGCYISLMSGTPAPKAPTDWWSISELAQAGYLKEKSVIELRNNLCLIEERESASGQTYPHIVTWLDDSKKCKVCGKLEQEHEDVSCLNHVFMPSKNMLHDLYLRLKGLVMVKKIDECLELPELVRRVIRVKPSVDILRAAQLIRNSSTRAAQKLTLLRELSDGFQYQDVESGTIVCPRCKGSGRIIDKISESRDEDGLIPTDMASWEDVEADCPNCEGIGIVKNYEVQPVYVGSPKEDFIRFLLEEYSEYGRFVIWASFTASIDKITDICIKEGWLVLKIDGRGIKSCSSSLEEEAPIETLFDCMDYSHPRHDELLRMYEKVVVVAHPMSGGMAYTFTSAPADCYFSNDFNAETKIQSGARIRRGGMCTTRGVTSYELVHLPEDMFVIENLDNKKTLQAVTLNDLETFKFDQSKTEFFDGKKYI